MENEKQVIMVLDENGNEKEAEILAVFSLKEAVDKKKYIIYTLNEKDENGMVKIYASILIEQDEMYSFETIESDEEWAKVKDVMKQLARD